MNKLVLISSISTALLISACAPRDTKLVRPDTRVTPASLEANPEFESNKHLLVLIAQLILY